MNPLESQKQLLIAESELNRAQLLQAWQSMAGEVHMLTEQVRTVRSLVSAATSLVAGLNAYRRKVSPAPGKKNRWWQTLLQGAGIVSSCWNEFNARPKA